MDNSLTFTNRYLGFTLGKSSGPDAKEFTFQRYGTTPSPEPSKTRDDRDYSYARFFFRQDDTAQPLFSATWRLNQRARSMVFFYHDPRTKQIRLHIIRSFLPST